MRRLPGSRDYPGNSPEDRPHDVRFFLDAGQTLVESAVFDREPLVVDSQKMQNGRVHVADVNRIADDIVADLVGLAVRDGPRTPNLGGTAMTDEVGSAVVELIRSESGHW